MVSSGCYITIVAAVYILNILRRSHQFGAFVDGPETEDESTLKEITGSGTSGQAKQPSTVKVENTSF